MSNQSDHRGTTPSRPIPLLPIYAFSLLSALAVIFALRLEHFVRAVLLGAGFVFAAIAVAWFTWFLLAADDLFQAINYRALVFGFVSFLVLALVFEFLMAFGLRLPPLPRFGIPVCLIVLWTIGLILAALWLRFDEGREE